MLLLSVAREVFSAVGGSADQSAEHLSSEVLNRILISSPAHQGGEIRTRGQRGRAVKGNTVSGQDMAIALRNPPLLW